MSELKKRVIDELAQVQGRVAIAQSLDAEDAKEQLREAHAAQRLSKLRDASDWLSTHETTLIRHFADGSEVVPKRIDPVVIPVRTPLDADLFRFTTLEWSVPVSVGYGRRSRFLVRDRQNDKVMAVFALGDPVIAQSARDKAIGWDTAHRNARLYNVYDAYVLGAVEPYRQLLGGKLAALLTLSNEVREFLTIKYRGNTTGIRGEVKDPTPVLVTTSSALGRSSVYNRVTFEGRLMFNSVGYTKGFGHFQFSNELFDALLEFVREEVLTKGNEKVGSSRYGSGPNWRFRVIRTALDALGIPTSSLQHNVKREVFLAPCAYGWDEYLRGESDQVVPYDLPADALGSYFRERWAVPRAERRPGFALWSREQARLTPLLAGADIHGTLPVRASHGRVDLGDYSLAVGVGKRKVRGTSLSGENTNGVAYFSRLEGPDLMITLADIEWENGEREIGGWDRHESSPVLQEVVGRLRIGISGTTQYRGMSMMEVRLLHCETPTDKVSAAKTEPAELLEVFGFDFVNAFDSLGEATLGTRESLLSDKGPRKNQLCLVFDTRDRTVPAVAWSLLRGIALHMSTYPNSVSLASPKVVRRAPRLEELAESHD